MRPRELDDGQRRMMMFPPVIKTKNPTTKSCTIYKYAGCLLGKLGKIPTGSSVTTPLEEMVPREGNLDPGSPVFANEYKSFVGGRKWEYFGKEKQPSL